MPSVIPYDPSLVLGNLVSQAKLDNLTQISSIQAPIDAAEDTMNSYISMKRSIDMTIQELINMNIDTTELIKNSNGIGTQIQQAAIAFANAKIDGETKIQPLKAKIQVVNDDIESPVDYNKTQIKKMPLSSDSLKMNVQYFSNDENAQNSSTTAATVKSFISDQTSIFGDTFSTNVAGAAQSQINSQYSNHSIAGTLVISVTCTHKDAVLLAPFIIDVDKAIRAWNKIYPSDMIKTDSLSNILQIANKADTTGENSLTLLSGATYGSCFIGMVHVLNTTITTASEDMYSIASSIQEQFTVSEWFANESGGFGVDGSFSNDAKNLMSSQNISSHCSLVSMGSIPSIKSNNVALAVKQFSDFDGAKSMQNLAALQQATAGDKQTVDSAADKARTGAQMLAMENSKVQGVLSGLSDIDDKQNKIIDINSLMDALDDYIQKALDGNIGVPINYYLKPITKSQLAEMWMAKYYPSKYLAISGDDSQASGTTSTGTSGSGTPSST
jgi:hypothetical protein